MTFRTLALLLALATAAAAAAPVVTFREVSPGRVRFSVIYDGDIDSELPSMVSLAGRDAESFPRLLLLEVSESTPPVLALIAEYRRFIDLSAAVAEQRPAPQVSKASRLREKLGPVLKRSAENAMKRFGRAASVGLTAGEILAAYKVANAKLEAKLEALLP